MAKKGRKPVAAALQAAPKKANPFELKKSKTHFEAVGRRLGGSVKNVIKARQDAINKRKKTLLVEYKQLRKANAFVDRRFGEDDGRATEDEKVLARLRAQRMREAKKKRGSKYILGDDNAGGENGSALGGLTHLGKSLSELEDLNEAPNLDDLDDDMLEDIVRQYNFGGGDEEAGGDKAGGDGKPKTRKQVMEEIIAKSKAYKALKAKQREEDEEQLDKLNDEFRELVRSRALAAFTKPAGYMKGVKVKADTEDDGKYDVLARELAQDARGAAGDRTLGPEELAERERERLELLEKERLKRMRAEPADGEADGISAVPAGGYAAKRARLRQKEDDAERRQARRDARSGDALDDDYDLDGEHGEGDDDEGEEDGEGASDDEEAKMLDGLSGLDKRRVTRAAGDHPLQEGFRAQAAALLAKYGMKADNPLVADGSEDDDEGEEGEDDDEDEEGEEEEEDGEGEELGTEELGSLSGEGEGEEEDGEGAEEGESEDGGQSGSGDEDEEVDAAELEAMRRERANPSEQPSTSAPAASAASAAAGASRQQQQQQQGKALDGPLDLPFTIPIPESYDTFARLVKGRPPAELVAAVQRIRAFNATALAAESKRKLQVFYGILVQHFAMLAGEAPTPIAHLDALLPLLLTMTSEVPFYAATVARARLSKLHERLSASLSASSATAADGSKKPAPESPWPGARALLQVKLFVSLFPTSDKRHPVTTPAFLLVGKYLSQCTAATVREAATGLLLCGLALHMATPAKRSFPEVISFLTDALRAFAPPPAASQQQQAAEADAEGVVRVVPGLLAPAAQGPALAALGAPPAPQLLEALHPAAPQQQDEDLLKLGLLSVALRSLLRAAALFTEKDSFPQAFAPALAAVAALAPPAKAPAAGKQKKGAAAAKRQQEHQGLTLPEELEQLRAQVESSLRTSIQEVVASRVPLVQAHRIRAPVIREYNPRFEDGFSLGRDYDPDRQRAEERRFKRQLQKEKRGALRELRRDAAFMAEARDRERASVDAERMDSQKKFYAELQKQASDLRSGGQGGMNPHLKKKKK